MSVDVLQSKIRKLKNPCMLGLDPSPEVVPPQLFARAYAEFDHTPRGQAEAYRAFCEALLDAFADVMPAVKLQSACFSALGFEGVRVMQELLQSAKRRGYYVLLDAMRADVENIAQLCADSLFGSLRLGQREYRLYDCDAVTVNAYLGSDSIRPFLPYLRGEEPKNIFLIVRTSNKSSGEVQDLISGDRLVHTAVADLAMRWSGEHLFGRNGYSEIVAVVGASRTHVLQELRRKYDRLFFMVPGYGAQGGTGKGVSPAFDALGHGAIVSASRSIIGAWRGEEDSDGSDYVERALAAAERMRKNILQYVTVL